MRVCLVTLGDPKTLTGGYLYHLRMAELAAARDAEMSFFSFPDRAFPTPMLAGRRMLKSAASTDVLVIDSIAAWCAAPWLGKVDVPVVGMLHQLPGGMDHGAVRRALQAPLDRRAYRYMATVMVASEALGRDLSREINDDRIVVVAPGRDVAHPSREIDDLKNGRSAALLSVGNWVPRKGTVELLEAFSSLPRGLATLHLVGRKDVDRAYARRVEELLRPLGDRVVVHGPIPKEDVAAMYLAADAFVLPSLEEPYGTVYGEAMASGLPVIGWRAGNLPYLAEDGVSGIIVEPGDMEGLSEAMKRVSEDEALRTRLANAALEGAQSFPTWHETADRFFGVLRGLI